MNNEMVAKYQYSVQIDSKSSLEAIANNDTLKISLIWPMKSMYKIVKINTKYSIAIKRSLLDDKWLRREHSY